MGPHRADIVGNGGIVVELQHSAIGHDEIRARENFYGSMIWMFDATHRFRMVVTGGRAFFTFGRTKHIETCEKPVFLDFGEIIVEVETFTDLMPLCSGFGTARDRHWFIAQHLSEGLRDSPKVRVVRSDDSGAGNPWERKCPYRTMKDPIRWVVDPVTQQVREYPKGTPYLLLNYKLKRGGQDWRPQEELILESYPALANGWDKDAMWRMRRLLGGMFMIFDGSVRLLPMKAEHNKVEMTVVATEALLKEAEEHIRAGRVPVMNNDTQALLVERARQHEVAQYGKPLQGAAGSRKRQEHQRGLFD